MSYYFFERWRLCEDLTVVQAAYLLSGYDPAYYPDYELKYGDHGYNGEEAPFLSALKRAIHNQDLSAVVRHKASSDGALVSKNHPHWNFYYSPEETASLEKKGGFDRDPECYYEPSVDWGQTTIKLIDLKKWLEHKGYCCDFLPYTLEPWEEDFPPAPSSINQPKYLDKSHPCHSTELKAAIDAWEAVSSQTLKNKSPKQALIKWLEDNAKDYGLTKEAISRIATLTNWSKTGGAPSTTCSTEPSYYDGGEVPF